MKTMSQIQRHTTISSSNTSIILFPILIEISSRRSREIQRSQWDIFFTRSNFLYGNGANDPNKWFIDAVN